MKCSECGTKNAHSYKHFDTDCELHLCVRCARLKRKQINNTEPSDGLTREEFIEKLDRFFEASGMFEICRMCHEQGTGCCPSTCRVMGSKGCNPQNKYGKTMFCAGFICSALMNAVWECDPEMARTLKQIKNGPALSEYRIYEMITRVPSTERDPERPLTLPQYYSNPDETGLLSNGGKIRDELMKLASEIGRAHV